jgi:nucleotide-binding universal stress UspA family protein
MTERITHILVPMDFSPASDAALAGAKDLADRYGARLSLMHVVTDPKATGFWTAELYVPALPETRDRFLREARERLENLLTAEERTRVNVTIVAKIGAVAEEIQNFARENHVDLIVMGTHGRKGLAHLFLGSVAEGVVRSAPCPVLTTRAEVGTPLQIRIAERDRERNEHEEEHAPGQHLEASDAEEQR